MQWIVPLQSSTLPSKCYSLVLISLIREKQNLKLNLLNLIWLNLIFLGGADSNGKKVEKMLIRGLQLYYNLGLLCSMCFVWSSSSSYLWQHVWSQMFTVNSWLLFVIILLCQKTQWSLSLFYLDCSRELNILMHAMKR